MLRIALCDDERIVREEVVRCLNEYSKLRNVDILCDQYETGQEFLRSKTSYNIVMLDYQLDKDEDLNGLSVAQRLRSNNKDIVIVFLTNYPRVVFSSFEVDTFRFLVKPLNPQKLRKAMDDFLKVIYTDSTLMIRIDGATTIINTKHIMYIEAEGKYCIIHMSKQSQPIDCRETLASIEQRLPEEIFCRCHHSFIVNLKFVQSYDHQDITLRNGNHIYISRRKYQTFEDEFLVYSKRYGY